MKKNLRRFSGLMAVVFLLSSMLVGCGERGASTGSDTSSEDGKLKLTIVGGSIGGAWAAIGEGVSEVMRRSYPGSEIAYEVGQEASNVALVSNNKVQLGIAHESFLNLAAKGKEPFAEEYGNLRALAVLYGEAAEHFLILKDSGMNSFDDIKDNNYPLKVNFNTKDSFMEIVGKKCLEAYDITYEDIQSWGGKVDFMSMGSSIDLIRDGKIEAYSNVIQVPSSHILDASSNLDLNLLAMSEEAIEKVNAEIGTYKAVISKDQYSFLEEDVPTVAASVVLFTNAELSDDEAYAVVKSIDENLDYFTGIHASLKGLDIEKLQDINGIEIHPGAVKYYEENK
ncbi:TAXI family TRAP transporter solute-binding subunit [Sedimentibacter sp. MB31-C6]|uniref:TAXI family TRAP transporter solute-binding subunit n=1 Tax=Sedimentibacter sp. MB31-C6 TaxID=3109366 RepID=UPI002DDCA2C4|nr:TAXI family TRAP transporter solute-binding subunit [Sedimentibacter sp. MB36-C1]WSI03390.1 TAXI family TRAP transporter solute-binding subunit [Sedimentibacter sp. MB36-C1]